ncbi:MAG: DUF58 domain-containing protein [Pirellula sp.]|jgi:uncharacterized protein (DUF58 family)|nr:DUF58 domain-containing protein [Pirellula sp.]
MLLVPLIVALLALGIITGTTWFSVSVIALLLVFKLTGYFSKNWAELVSIERSISTKEIEIGGRVSVGLQIKNRSRQPIPWVLLEDSILKSIIYAPHKSLELVGSNVKLYELRSGQSGLLAYDLKGVRRGYFRIGPTLLETGDLFGLNRQHRVVSGSDYLLVLPKIIPIEGIELTSQRPLGDLRVSDRSMEDPSQMAGVREYRMGDPLNRIHWKATARTGQLHTRVFEPTCMQGAMMILDLNSESNPENHEPIRTDLAVTAAASLAHAYYLLNQPCGLICNGIDMAERYSFQELTGDYTDRNSLRSTVQKELKNDRLRPIVVEHGNGVETFTQIHKTLARVGRSEGLTFFELVQEVRNRLPRSLTVIAILQTVSEESAMALEMLKRQGYSVAVMLNHDNDSEGIDMAARLVSQRLTVYSLADERSVPYICQNLLAMR